MFAEFKYLVGLIAALMFAVYAFRKRELTETGTLGAVIFGLMIFAYGGWHWFLLIALFLASSSLLTRYRAKAKESVSREFEKGGSRDFWQVTANGAIPAVLALAFEFSQDPLLYAAFAAAVAAATADTWATELGILAPNRPRLLTTGEIVPKGTSGAVSALGFTVALAGASLIALSALALHWSNDSLMVALGFEPAGMAFNALLFVLVVTIAGFMGTLVDSLLGAAIQRMYWCNKCQKLTERPLHSCGEKTDYKQGFKWVDNDVVNFFSAGSAAALVIVAGTYLL